MQALLKQGAATLSTKSGDIFDEPGPLTAWFVNPFTLDCDPLSWRELQDAFAAAFDRNLTEDEALLELRLRNPATGPVVVPLTEPQRAEVEAMMEVCERSMAFDTVAWLLGDCLLRASRAAARAP